MSQASEGCISFAYKLFIEANSSNTFFGNPCDVFKHMSVFSMWKCFFFPILFRQFSEFSMYCVCIVTLVSVSVSSDL